MVASALKPWEQVEARAYACLVCYGVDNTVIHLQLNDAHSSNCLSLSPSSISRRHDMGVYKYSHAQYILRPIPYLINLINANFIFYMYLVLSAST